MKIKPENYFVLYDGTTVRSLFELSKTLDTMPDEVFHHHVNPERNDFSNWVRDVVKNKELAENMLNAKNTKEMQKVLRAGIQKKVEKAMNPGKSKKVSQPKKEEAKKQETPKKEEKTVKQAPKKPTHFKFGIHCPWKTIHCGSVEFLVGMIAGLLLALLLNIIF